MKRCRWCVAALAVPALALGAAGCGDDAPPSAGPPPPGLDAGLDAAPDAEPSPDDAGPDAERPPAHGDTCADPIDLRAEYEPGQDGAYLAPGDLDDFRDDYDGCGLPNFDTDAVYRYVPPATGQIRTRLDDLAYADVIVSTTCAVPEESGSCAGYAGYECSAEPCGVLVPVSAGTPVYLVVDGLRTTRRQYELTLQFYPWREEGEDCLPSSPAGACAPNLLCRVEEAGAQRCRAMICGDGIVDGDLFTGPAEECDDGNLVDGDGCTASCTIAAQGPGGEDCATAAALHLVPSNASLFPAPYAYAESDTTAAAAELSGSCATSAASPDQVFRLDLAEAAPLTLAVSSATDGYVPLLYLLEDDGGGTCAGAELGCAAAAAGEGAVLTFDSLDPGTYFVVVDGQDDAAVAAGSFVLEAIAAIY